MYKHVKVSLRMIDDSMIRDNSSSTSPLQRTCCNNILYICNSLLRDDSDALRQAEVQAPQRLRVISGEQLRHQVLVMVTVTLRGWVRSFSTHQ